MPIIITYKFRLLLIKTHSSPKSDIQLTDNRIQNVRISVHMSQQFYQSLNIGRITTISIMPKLHISKSMATCLLFALLISLVKTDCPLVRYPRQTTVGYVQAAIDYTPNNPNAPQVYQYPLIQEVQGTSPPKTAVAVSGFSVEKKSQQFGYKIQASFPQIRISSVIFTVSTVKGTNNNRWRNIVFNFIVSEIPELILGTKTFTPSVPSSISDNYKVSQLLPLWGVNFNFQARPKIFISGIEFIEKNPLSTDAVGKIDETIAKIQSLRNYAWNIELIKRFTSILSNQKQPNIKLGQPQFLSNGLLRFDVNSFQVQLKYLSYSYAIYLHRTGSELWYNSVSGSFVAEHLGSFNYDKLKNDGMKIIGMTGLRYSNQASAFLGLSIQTAQVNRQPAFISRLQGTLSEFQMSYMSIQTLSGAVCRSCPNSPLIFSQFCVSECPYGFVSSINSDGAFYCLECNIQKFMVTNQDQRSCVCAAGHYLVSPTQTCQRCPYDCLTCNGDRCLTCDTSSPSYYRTLNPATGRCQCPSIGFYDDAILQSRICIQCNIRCKTCRGPELYHCTSCPARRTLTNGICKCDENFVQNQRGDCICASPYNLNQNGQCTLSQNRCGDNQIFSILPTGQRICSCKPGYTRNMMTNKCIQECQSYEQFNYQSNRCECKSGSVRNQVTQICVACSSKLNQIFNPYTNQCECVQGFEMNKAGNCITCPPKTFYSMKTDQCECIFNYYRNTFSGPCMKCTSEWQNSGCRSIGRSTSGNLDL